MLLIPSVDLSDGPDGGTECSVESSDEAEYMVSRGISDRLRDARDRMVGDLRARARGRFGISRAGPRGVSVAKVQVDLDRAVNASWIGIVLEAEDGGHRPVDGERPVRPA